MFVQVLTEAYLYLKRGPCIWQKRPICISKEACAYGKRGLYLRVLKAAKETYSCGKRRLLLIRPKRPIQMAKEAYAYGKRDLLTYWHA
jgi:hypothetical protein